MTLEYYHYKLIVSMCINLCGHSVSINILVEKEENNTKLKVPQSDEDSSWLISITNNVSTLTYSQKKEAGSELSLIVNVNTRQDEE